MTDTIKLSENELNVLSNFFPEGKEITLKIIQERTNLSYEPVHRIMKQLADKKLLFKKKFGKTLVYSLDFTKEKIRIAFILYANEKKEKFEKKYGEIYRALSKIEEDSIDFLAIFGSYAKGSPAKKSDVDVLCVSSKKNKVESKIKGLRYETNLEFAPVLISKSEFTKIKKENRQFWDDLIDYGLIFKGYELFYFYAYLK
ncbi:MAG: nucleotidyltransferase domain-containing protein [Nanoarchaeota archaeon]|nr:nucleotidyltransferase domain-containing protein [Nanoarchaeota archaeon]MBU1103637.1 nucleotidyltransferase domain-containing protein [Nanoarchaeota archaeon]